jgi:glycosyltransferase involved in cell wall biosynthesis
VESLGLVLVEAWANSKPVIAANIDVSRELITSSGGGAIVPFGDAPQLADEIEKMLSDPELRRKMGAGGRKKALDYEGDTPWQRTAEEMERVVVAGKRSSGISGR